jgi:hypothetical protein
MLCRVAERQTKKEKPRLENRRGFSCLSRQLADDDPRATVMVASGKISIVAVLVPTIVMAAILLDDHHLLARIGRCGDGERRRQAKHRQRDNRSDNLTHVVLLWIFLFAGENARACKIVPENFLNAYSAVGLAERDCRFEMSRQFSFTPVCSMTAL